MPWTKLRYKAYRFSCPTTLPKQKRFFLSYSFLKQPSTLIELVHFVANQSSVTGERERGVPWWHYQSDWVGTILHKSLS